MIVLTTMAFICSKRLSMSRFLAAFVSAVCLRASRYSLKARRDHFDLVDSELSPFALFSDSDTPPVDYLFLSNTVREALPVLYSSLVTCFLLIE